MVLLVLTGFILLILRTLYLGLRIVISRHKFSNMVSYSELRYLDLNHCKKIYIIRASFYDVEN